MAKIWKNKNNPFFIRLLAFILTPFAFIFPGLVSCIPVAYYMGPVADIEANGRVGHITPSGDTNWLEGIRASLLDGTSELLSGSSDSMGFYILQYYDNPTTSYTLQFTDIDGVSNGGSFLAQEISLLVTESYFYTNLDIYMETNTNG